MLTGILLTANIIVCLALIGVVLLQRSEGGALGMGGGPTGFMSARGAGDLLTRITWILFTIFVLLSFGLTLLSGRERASQSIVDRMKIDRIDPNALKQGPAAPAPGSVPPPVQAPTPQLNQFDPQLSPTTPSAAAPAPAQVPAPGSTPTPQ
ncbi:preprotein translocase subunit SecG [Caulobacter segnis]|uniref:preprotein translocase subunit SecG n=1 Tax=Caulobacter segnis TaxID=88688 RepID=UPI00240FABE7|nr:preprotein translocase subunit SecG [Caulobacter segnis]MDG2522050.1 preprotein translocase subunit SecG [Caulobacter segnis]